MFDQLLDPSNSGPNTLSQPASHEQCPIQSVRSDVREASPQSLGAGRAISTLPTHPPSSGSVAPPNRSRAPARVKNVIKLIEDVRDGREGKKQLLIRRKLLGTEFRQLCKVVEDDEELRGFVHDKLRSAHTLTLVKMPPESPNSCIIRFDYIRTQKQFTIRMPSFVHDTFAGRLSMDITDWFSRIKYTNERSSDRTIATVAMIDPTVGSNILFPVTLPGCPEQQGPDVSFQHDDSIYPGLVIEVAWSQRPLKLSQRADCYIRRSNGGIHTVIGVDLHDIWLERQRPGSGSQMAKFSIWRAKVDDPTGDAKISGTRSVLDQVGSFPVR